MGQPTMKLTNNVLVGFYRYKNILSIDSRVKNGQKTSLVSSIRLAAVLAALVFLFPHKASYAYYPSDSDLKFLPKYCVARLRSKNVGKAESNKYKNILGRETWKSFHHYCQGVNYVKRGQRGTNQDIRYKDFTEGVNNLKYHLEIYGRNFPLRAQTLYLIGVASKEIENLGEAIQSLREAVKIKPKYPAAYRALSDIYVDIEDHQEALSVIDTGLKYSPKSRSLLKRRNRVQKALSE